MLIGGQPLAVVWAGSAIELSSRPVHTVLFDERDLAEDLPARATRFRLRRRAQRLSATEKSL